ncbi:hypothetical protein XENOCAPTIV_019085, partial [Xenoophorus captivus]
YLVPCHSDTLASSFRWLTLCGGLPSFGLKAVLALYEKIPTQAVSVTQEQGEDCAACEAMQRVTAQLVAGLLAAVLSLLSEQCWADGGGPSLAERVIWAVNAGGDAHVDVHGIHFKKDPLEGKIGKGKSA